MQSCFLIQFPSLKQKWCFVALLYPVSVSASVVGFLWTGYIRNKLFLFVFFAVRSWAVVIADIAYYSRYHCLILQMYRLVLTLFDEKKIPTRYLSKVITRSNVFLWSCMSLRLLFKLAEFIGLYRRVQLQFWIV